MTRYVAFLRGINISGKNKVPMAELKELFLRHGFMDVRTYLNSGNVLFSSKQKRELLTEKIEEMLRSTYPFPVPVYVISQNSLKDILDHAPLWWGNDDKAVYDNLIFLFPPTTFAEVYAQIGEPKEGLEKIENYEEAVFWSFDLKQHQKTNWWPKTAMLPIKDSMTIRTANTVRKIAEM